MSEDLKPCPFCGMLYLSQEPNGVRCLLCGAKGPSDRLSKFTWNDREDAKRILRQNAERIVRRILDATNRTDKDMREFIDEYINTKGEQS